VILFLESWDNCTDKDVDSDGRAVFGVRPRLPRKRQPMTVLWSIVGVFLGICGIFIGFVGAYPNVRPWLFVLGLALAGASASALVMAKRSDRSRRGTESNTQSLAAWKPSFRNNGLLCLYVLAVGCALFAVNLVGDMRFRITMFGDDSVLWPIAAWVGAYALFMTALVKHANDRYGLRMVELAQGAGANMFLVCICLGSGAACIFLTDGFFWKGLGWAIMVLAGVASVMALTWLVRRTGFVLGAMLFATTTILMGSIYILLMVVLVDRSGKRRE
jgi:hypothetical protein